MERFGSDGALPGRPREGPTSADQGREMGLPLGWNRRKESQVIMPSHRRRSQFLVVPGDLTGAGSLP